MVHKLELEISIGANKHTRLGMTNKITITGQAYAPPLKPTTGVRHYMCKINEWHYAKYNASMKPVSTLWCIEPVGMATVANKNPLAIYDACRPCIGFEAYIQFFAKII